MRISVKSSLVSAQDLYHFIKSVVSHFADDYQNDYHESLVRSFGKYEDHFHAEYAEYLAHMNSFKKINKKIGKKGQRENFENLQQWRDLYEICLRVTDDIKKLKRSEILHAFKFKTLSIEAEKEALFSKNSYEKRLKQLAFFEENGELFIDLFHKASIDFYEYRKKLNEIDTDAKDQKNDFEYPDFLLQLMWVGVLTSILPFAENPKNFKNQVKANIKKLFHSMNFHAIFCTFSDYYFSIAQKRNRIILNDLDQQRFNTFFATIWTSVILEEEINFDKLLVSKLQKMMKNSFSSCERSNEKIFYDFYEFLNESFFPEENIDTKNKKVFEVKTTQDIRAVFNALRIMNLYSKDIISFQEMVLVPFIKKVEKNIVYQELELMACHKFIKALSRKYKHRFEKYFKNHAFSNNVLTLILYRSLKNCRSLSNKSTLEKFAHTYFVTVSDLEFKLEKRIPISDNHLENAIETFSKNLKPASKKQAQKAA